jgi:hypothetical protein
MLLIYGYSDDLIEIEGDIREEFSAATNETGWLALSCGTLIRYKYDDDGIWRFQVSEDAGRFATHWVSVEEGAERDDTNVPEYSQVVRIDVNVRWVLHGEDLARA